MILSNQTSFHEFSSLLTITRSHLGPQAQVSKFHRTWATRQNKIFFYIFAKRTDVIKTLVTLFILCFASLSYDSETSSLRILDEALKNTGYQEEKEQIIAQIFKQAKDSSANRELYFWNLSRLRDEYAFYQIDSAMSYSLKSLKVALEIGREDLITVAKLHMAEEFIQQGMYIEAKEWLDALLNKDIPSNQLETYYYQYNALYEALGQCTDNLDIKYSYKQKEHAYKDSIINVAPSNIFIKTALLSASNQEEKALSALLDRYNEMSPDDRDIGPIAYMISTIYRQFGNRAEEKKYLIISSISDMKSSVKEYLSLRRLAEILFEEGDYARAHKYITRCMNDAMFSGARLRMVQVSSILPVFEGTYQHKLRVRVIILSISLITIILLMITLAVLLRQKHEQQIQLCEANKLLSESGAIKNVYIFKLMMESVSRIETLDNYRKMLKKKYISGEKYSVLDDLKSTDIIDEQWRTFYRNFDSIFLEMFPSFIDGVNSLMTKENQFAKNDSLSVELRILALIRLGIEDTDRIAAVLNYSKSTVYSYRSRIRLRSLDPKKFEERLKNIKSI